jgi:pimeloyl-ACP methyl ester carboxylesterase
VTAGNIHLESVEGLHIGGELRAFDGFPANLRFENNGHHMVGQMYAQYFRVADPCTATPLALWHGGGMTGACWETTPDGRPGWLDYFLREGFSVALCDAFERGRASLPAHPQVFDGVPEYRSLDSIWHHFRFGPPLDVTAEFPGAGLRSAAYAGQQFPVERIEQFGRQFVARFTNSDAPALAAYAALLQRMGSCAIVAHSQGGVFALRSALASPARISAVVALEPPVSDECLANLRNAADVDLPAHLFVFGDFIRGCSGPWEPFLENAQRYCDELARRGVAARMIELPALGIRGNSHMLQMDANNREIAALVKAWLLALEQGR